MLESLRSPNGGLFRSAVKSKSNGVNSGARLAPMLPGAWPAVGHTPQFIRKPIEMLQEGFEQFGRAFRIQLLNKRVHVFIGPEGNQTIFCAPDSIVSPREVYRFTVPVFGKGMVYDAEPDVMNEQMGFLLPALRGKNMKTYVELMVAEVDTYLATLPTTKEVDLVDFFTTLTTYISSRCLIGVEFRNQLDDRFTHLFHDLEKGMNQIAFFMPNAPLPSFRRRDAARREMVKLFGKIIDERRNSGRQEPDLLQALVEARYKDGRLLTHDEITGLLVAITFAGHHNSAVIGAWLAIDLLKNPTYLKRVLQEHAAVHGPTGEVSLESVKQANQLEWAVKEVGRLRPPLVMLMRQVKQDFQVAGYTIPAGDMAMVSPAVSHRDPEAFANPHLFDPDRFGPGREEDKRAHALITFGGGEHKCIGMAFATLMQKTMWSALLSRVEFELLDKDYVADFDGFVVGPRRPARARVTKKSNPYAWLR